jgi:hypothetical protein
MSIWTSIRIQFALSVFPLSIAWTLFSAWAVTLLAHSWQDGSSSTIGLLLILFWILCSGAGLLSLWGLYRHHKIYATVGVPRKIKVGATFGVVSIPLGSAAVLSFNAMTGVQIAILLIYFSIPVLLLYQFYLLITRDRPANFTVAADPRPQSDLARFFESSLVQSRSIMMIRNAPRPLVVALSLILIQFLLDVIMPGPGANITLPALLGGVFLLLGWKTIQASSLATNLLGELLALRGAFGFYRMIEMLVLHPALIQTIPGSVLTGLAWNVLYVGTAAYIFFSPSVRQLISVRQVGTE